MCAHVPWGPGSGGLDVRVGGHGGGGRFSGVTVWGGSRSPSRPPGPVVVPVPPAPVGASRVPADPAALRRRARPAGSPPAFPQGRLESRGAGRWSGPLLLVRPLAVQVPSAFRRGGLKTPWGGVARPPVGRGRWARRRGESRREGPGPSPRLTPHGLRPLAGAAPHARPSPPPRAAAAVGWGLCPAAVVVPSRACCARRAVCPAPWGREPPGRLWGVRAGSPRRGRRARLPVEVKPSDPSPESGSVTCLAGRPEATPSGGVPCQEGLPVSGAPSPHRPRTTLSGGSLGSCVDEERS